MATFDIDPDGITLAESGELQNTGTPTSTEDNDDDIALADLQTNALALHNLLFGTADAR